LKDLVPEYISNNSVFESLDKTDKEAVSNGLQRKIKLQNGITSSKSDFLV